MTRNPLWAVAAFIPLAAAACSSAGAAGPRTVTISMHYSKFSDARIDVPLGVPVRFVLRNDDPIDHEVIVGDVQLQIRHETGTEPSHGDRPTERDVPALSTVETTITFDQPGTVFFACHAPGHYDYGMRGELVVVRR